LRNKGKQFTAICEQAGRPSPDPFYGQCVSHRKLLLYTQTAQNGTNSTCSTKQHPHTQIAVIIVAYGRELGSIRRAEDIGASWSYHLSDKRADDSSLGASPRSKFSNTLWREGGQA